jgi:hypothetical protein
VTKLTFIKSVATPVERAQLDINVLFDSPFDLMRVVSECKTLVDRCFSARLNNEAEGDLSQPFKELLEAIIKAGNEFDEFDE